MDTEKINPLTHTKYMKPQEPWGWPIAVYLFLAGMGAGSFVIGAVMDWMGLAAELPSAGIVLWGVLLVVIGTPFLILDLGIKTRVLNVIMNPMSSWLSRGFFILMAFMIVGILALGVSLLPLIGISTPPVLLRTLEGIGIVLAFSVAIYTGILLKSTKYVTLWSTWWLPALFTASALSTGSMLIILTTLTFSTIFPAVDSAPLREMVAQTELFLILIEAFVLFLFLFLRYRTKVQGERSVRLLLSGNLKYLFWIGIVILGFLFPTILEVVHLPQFPLLPFLTGLLVLTAGFLLRIGILRAGIKEQPPLTKIIIVPGSVKKTTEMLKFKEL